MTKPMTDEWRDKLHTWIDRQYGTAGWEQKLENLIDSLLDQATSKAREEELDKIIDAVKKSYETQRDFNGDIESRGIAYGWNNCLDFIQSLIQKDK
jgi:uncharacterized protein YihD (DUF1040 family)